MKIFLIVFLAGLIPLSGGIAYMIFFASTTSTYATFWVIMAFCAWIIFCIEYGARIQRRLAAARESGRA